MAATREQLDWPVYGGAAENNHYSNLAQINRNNVKQLVMAWSFDTQEQGVLQTSPIIVDGVLYGITPTQKVFALNAANGKLIWKFDSGIAGTQPDRGLAYWKSGNDRRILVGVMNFVYALDAATGKPISGFGEQGRIDLRENLGRSPASSQSISMTSPGVVYKDLLIVGGRNPETLPAPPGDVRAYDVRTGKLRWSFHTIPHPGEFGYDTWPKDAWKYSGAANNWAGMTVDAKRGIVYVPTGSAAMDFYGANRAGDDLFANCLLALNAETGERIWYFQGVRHDIWDRDFPAPPVLLTVKRDGKNVDAVAQTTKQGFVYLFDRLNGKPLFPIEYRKYPASDVPGRSCSVRATTSNQARTFRSSAVHGRYADESDSRIASMGARTFPEYPKRRTVRSFGSGKRNGDFFPDLMAGAEWGGAAADPETGILYVNANDIVLDRNTCEEHRWRSKRPGNLFEPMRHLSSGQSDWFTTNFSLTCGSRRSAHCITDRQCYSPGQGADARLSQPER